MSIFASRRLRVCTLLLLVALLSTGCFFGPVLEIIIFGGDGDSVVSVSTTSTWTSCSEEDDGLYDCAYFSEDGISLFGISAVGLLFALLLIDPLVLQVPEGAYNFRASYSVDEGDGGALVVTAGLDSIRVDATRTLQAEPGTQLVIVDFPSDAPATGSGGFNLNFRIPDDLDALDIKALFTGKVTIEGETYYMPLYPCTSDMAALPTISVPMPNGGGVTLPVDEVEGCNGEVYSFTPAQTFDRMLLLPHVLNEGGQVALGQ